MTDTPWPYATITSLSQDLQKGRLSPVELVERSLDRINTLDPHLNAFRLVSPERALTQARAAEAALKAGLSSGPLHGISYAAKDLFDAQGLPTTAGCHLLADNIAVEDSAAIRRLTQAGMILLGKTNTVQFAYSGIGINHDHGTPHNPWHRVHHVPGGSSSGSGVAVAAGLVPMALGSDTGGSVRIPASLCGTTGLKTTVGRVSRAGVYPLSWSLDSVGPLTRSVEDAALVYQALQGPDPNDETTWGRPPQNVLAGLRDGVAGLRLAFGETVFWEDADPEVAKAVRECGHVFETLGASVRSIALPEAEEARRLNPRGLIIAAEAYTLNQKWVENHYDQLDPVVAERILLGKAIRAPEYLQNLRAWTDLRARVTHALRDIDALLVPATILPARPFTELDADRDVYTTHNLAYLRNTTIGNILNLCGVAVPCGYTCQGLPVGLMIYGKAFHEEMILRVGHAFQQATDWHRRTPDLAWIAKG